MIKQLEHSTKKESNQNTNKLLQLWLRSPIEDFKLYYNEINQACISSEALSLLENPNLNVNSKTTYEYDFNPGLSVLEDLFGCLKLGYYDLKNSINTGKKITISYELKDQYLSPFEIQDYLASSNHIQCNTKLNCDCSCYDQHVLLIHGILLAKNVVVKIETDSKLNSEFPSLLNKESQGKMKFSIDDLSILKIKPNMDIKIPVAVIADVINSRD